MWKDIFKPVLAQFLGSKKALAMLAGFIVWGLAQAGVVSSPDQVLPILAFIASYILGQGIADKGKEEAKVIASSLGKSPAPEVQPAKE